MFEQARRLLDAVGKQGEAVAIQVCMSFDSGVFACRRLFLRSILLLLLKLSAIHAKNGIPPLHLSARPRHAGMPTTAEKLPVQEKEEREKGAR